MDKHQWLDEFKMALALLAESPAEAIGKLEKLLCITEQSVVNSTDLTKWHIRQVRGMLIQSRAESGLLDQSEIDLYISEAKEEAIAAADSFVSSLALLADLGGDLDGCIAEASKWHAAGGVRNRLFVDMLSRQTDQTDQTDKTDKTTEVDRQCARGGSSDPGSSG